jgi:site-specific DNA-methyltransferase (adenine-specific)
MAAPYWTDGQVTLYHGDCREITEWLAADVLVTDPPYGRGWSQGQTRNDGRHADDSYAGIAGDEDTGTRDAALALWGARQGVVFGDLALMPPASNKLTLIYRKPSNAGTKGTFGGFRRDTEAIYLVGPWPGGHGGRSGVIETGARSHGNPSGVTGRYGHPHAKPVDVMETLIAACPPGTIADPFAGSGSTLVAARNLGRPAIGVELEERYCERAARRLSQTVMAAP